MPPKFDQSKQDQNQNNFKYDQFEDYSEEQKRNNFRRNPNWRPGQTGHTGQQGNAYCKRKKQNLKGPKGQQCSAGGESGDFNRQYQNDVNANNAAKNVFSESVQQQRDRNPWIASGPTATATATSTDSSGNSNNRGHRSPTANFTADGISSSEVHALVACPACYEIPRPPIFNCESGHITCTPCRERTARCSLCRQGYTNVRNYTVERLVENCTFKCNFHEQGCVAMVKGNEEDAHMQMCNFRPLGCDVYPCKTEHINYKDFVNHMRKRHRAGAGPVNQANFGREVHIRDMSKLMRQSCWVPFIMDCYGKTFLQFTQAVGGKMWFWVSLFGTPEEAERYRATLILSSQEKKMENIWRGQVHSVRHSGDDIYFNGLCMVTTEECIKAFIHSNKDGHPSFNLEVSIEKVR